MEPNLKHLTRDKNKALATLGATTVGAIIACAYISAVRPESAETVAEQIPRWLAIGSTYFVSFYAVTKSFLITLVRKHDYNHGLNKLTQDTLEIAYKDIEKPTEFSGYKAIMFYRDQKDEQIHQISELLKQNPKLIKIFKKRIKRIEKSGILGDIEPAPEALTEALAKVKEKSVGIYCR